ncbi:MAG: hypothetical protein COA67_03920 [Lutibacter sp.]|nr:MAG: hypothetical protein COA67_03920 [Lutibacter sp.]
MKFYKLATMLLIFIVFSCKKEEKDTVFKIYHLKPNSVYTTVDSLVINGSYSKRRNDFFVVKNYDINNEQHKIKIDSFVLNQIKKGTFLTKNKNSSLSLTFFKYGNGIDENTKHEYDTDYTIHNLFSYKKEIGSFYFNNRFGYEGSNYRISSEKLNSDKREIITNYYKEFDSILEENLDITGEYELINGKTHIIDSDTNKIHKGAIIIEKLSETDFGFYAAYKRKKITPIGDFGVLRNFIGNYYNIAICDEDWVEGYTKEDFTNGIYLHNEVIIKKKGDLLAIIRYGGNFRNYMLYKKKKPKSKFNVSLIRTLKSSRLEYDEFLLEYKKAKNCDENKLDIQYVFQDNIYITKHQHKEDYASFEKSHSFQNSHQNGRFVKKDSIFMMQLNSNK